VNTGVTDFPRKDEAIAVGDDISFDTLDFFVAVISVISLSATPFDTLSIHRANTRT
jgi:hypothetical protein